MWEQCFSSVECSQGIFLSLADVIYTGFLSQLKAKVVMKGCVLYSKTFITKSDCKTCIFVLFSLGVVG